MLLLWQRCVPVFCGVFDLSAYDLCDMTPVIHWPWLCSPSLLHVSSSPIQPWHIYLRDLRCCPRYHLMRPFHLLPVSSQSVSFWLCSVFYWPKLFFQCCQLGRRSPACDAFTHFHHPHLSLSPMRHMYQPQFYIRCIGRSMGKYKSTLHRTGIQRRSPVFSVFHSANRSLPFRSSSSATIFAISSS